MICTLSSIIVNTDEGFGQNTVLSRSSKVCLLIVTVPPGSTSITEFCANVKAQ